MSERSNRLGYRKLRRWPLIHDLLVFPIDAESPLGHVADIHLEGMRLVSEKSIPVGTEFSLWMILPIGNDERERVLFDARSLWSSRMGANRTDTGFRITDATLEAIQGIQMLLDQLFSENRYEGGPYGPGRNRRWGQ